MFLFCKLQWNATSHIRPGATLTDAMVCEVCRALTADLMSATMELVAIQRDIACRRRAGLGDAECATRQARAEEANAARQSVLLQLWEHRPLHR